MVTNQPPCYHEWVVVPVTTNDGRRFVEQCRKCYCDRPAATPKGGA